jgi:hypothetical protein
MGTEASLTRDDMHALANDVARAIVHASASASSAFVSTGMTYPSGSAAVARIDRDREGFFVSDDGNGALAAELMGATKTFAQIAPTVAARAGVGFDQRAFFVLHVAQDQLPGAVVAILSASARAVERTVFALEHERYKRSRVVFEDRVRSAFGAHATFDEPLRGVTAEWKFDAVIRSAAGVTSIFEHVSPAYQAVASANLKLGDVRRLSLPPRTTVVLADYEGTKPEYRSILAATSDRVLDATAEPADYRKAA